MTQKEELQKRINRLRKEQHDLIIQEDRKEITRKKYDELIEPVEKQIHLTNQEIFKVLSAENKERWSQPDKAVEEVNTQLKKIKEAQGIKQGRKRESTSWLSLVVKALTLKDTKNAEDIIAKVNKWRPGREDEKTEHQVKVTIYRVKKQYPGPYLDYTWNEEKYLLERKQK